MVSPLPKHCFKSGVSNSNVFKGHIVKNGALRTIKTKTNHLVVEWSPRHKRSAGISKSDLCSFKMLN
jgi:hypothetical protein